MSHAELSTRTREMRPLLVIALLLAGLSGFVIGQAWPANLSGPQEQVRPAIEDWHGNVRRSYWPE